MSGTAAGLLLAFWAVPIGARLFAGDFMLTLKPAVIDVRVAVFVGLLAIAASAVVILLSARSVVRAGLRQHLAEGAGGTRRLSRRLSMLSVEVAVAYLVTVTAVAGRSIARPRLERGPREDGRLPREYPAGGSFVHRGRSRPRKRPKRRRASATWVSNAGPRAGRA